MGLCIKCGTWHSSVECPPPKKVTCECGNSFLMPWDSTGLIEFITCGKCRKKMVNAKIEDV
jgi:hypothetical protein